MNPGGRIVLGSTKALPVEPPSYQYRLTDRLGNVPVTFGSDMQGKAVIIQEDHYYPFGMRMSGQHYTNTDLLNKFLYNGKELQDQTNYYDYGFRQMDPQLGRWHVIDAMAENHFSESAYSYAGNNPVNFVDVMGLDYRDHHLFQRVDRRHRNWHNDAGSGFTDLMSMISYMTSHGFSYYSASGGFSSSGKQTRAMYGKFWSSWAGKALMRIGGWKTDWAGSNYQWYTRDETSGPGDFEVGPVINASDFVGNGTGKNCFDDARLQSEEIGVSPSQDNDNSIFIYFAGGWKGQSYGHKEGYHGSNPGHLQQGGEYMVNEIDNGRSVTVCVDYKDGTVNRCGGDHWVTIVGYGVNDGESYFRFFDNFTEHPNIGTDPLLRFYYNNINNALQTRPDAYLFSPEYRTLEGATFTITAIRRNN